MKIHSRLYVYFFILFALQYLQCKWQQNSTIKDGDVVLIDFALATADGNRFDDNNLPSGNLPLRIQIGRNDFPFCKDSILLGKSESDSISFAVNISDIHYQHGLYYKTPNDSIVQIAKSDEKILVLVVVKKIKR